MNKTIILTIATKEITFNIDALAYNTFVNDVSTNNKVAPATNFIKRAVDKKDKEALETILNNNPGAALQISGKLMEEYAPELDIEVKN